MMLTFLLGAIWGTLIYVSVQIAMIASRIRRRD